MAQRITLLELTTVVETIVIPDGNDFTSLANRSVRRLYSKAATPGNMVVYHFPIDASGTPHDIVDGGEEFPLYSVLLPNTYSHASSFMVADKIITDHSEYDNVVPRGVSRAVIPLEATFSNAGFDPEAFVDYGDTAAGRMYGFPDNLIDALIKGKIDSHSVWCLARKAYVEAVDDADEFPFDNIAPMRLAILATVYEDENDLERASTYWDMALSELESDSSRYRGQQILNITYDDPAALEVTETIN